MPYTYNKLRGKIIEVFGSQNKFAEKLGKSKNCVSEKMTCKVGFSQEDIVEWSNLLGIEACEYGDYYFT